MLLEQGAALTLGHSAPDAEFDAVVERIGAAFGDDGAVSADHSGFALRGAADEQLVRVGLAATGLGDPRDAGFGLGALDNTVYWGARDCPARRGPCS